MPLPISVWVSALQPPHCAQCLRVGPSPCPHDFAQGLLLCMCALSVQMPAHSVVAGAVGEGSFRRWLRFPVRKCEGFSHGVNIGWSA